MEWWRKRLTIEEAREIAQDIWGHIEPSVDGWAKTNLHAILTEAADQQVTFPDH